jgi:hypothetical protein
VSCVQRKSVVTVSPVYLESDVASLASLVLESHMMCLVNRAFSSSSVQQHHQLILSALIIIRNHHVNAVARILHKALDFHESDGDAQQQFKFEGLDAGLFDKQEFVNCVKVSACVAAVTLLLLLLPLLPPLLLTGLLIMAILIHPVQQAQSSLHEVLATLFSDDGSSMHQDSDNSQLRLSWFMQGACRAQPAVCVICVIKCRLRYDAQHCTSDPGCTCRLCPRLELPLAAFHPTSSNAFVIIVIISRARH